MSITIATAARSADLVLPATVKSRLETPDSDDEAVAGLIRTASREVAEELGRPVPYQQYTEVAAGYGAVELYLSRFPIDPDRITVTIRGTVETDWEVLNAEEGILYRRVGWPAGDRPQWDADSVPLISVSYWAGWVLPEWLQNWRAGTTFAVDDWVRPLTANPLLMQCTTAGTTATSEPTWPAAGSTVADGTVTWTARNALELPEPLAEAAFLGVNRLYELRPDGLVSESTIGVGSQHYAEGSADHLLPLVARRIIARYRRY